MFEKFYDFVGVENKNNVTDMSGFMDIYGGETFLNGLYRIHNKNDVKKWNEILKRAFPKFKNGIGSLFPPHDGEILSWPRACYVQSPRDSPAS